MKNNNKLYVITFIVVLYSIITGFAGYMLVEVTREFLAQLSSCGDTKYWTTGVWHFGCSSK